MPVQQGSIPDCATMEPPVGAAPEPLLTRPGICSSSAHDHPGSLTDPRNLQAARQQL
jgi:hypothetical protein